ncbi:hypothetical protein KIN20_000533 [Parelaphostrongylus tenuis]|uniref:Uncharacterized protein n=1 Tax=Parelaphostrongylus tenuis TaxID=148309 RepID=A0AAD5LSN3_PARTN|nr:hypothetical protein KIN20_000533 [Parelaphostrongylus tenuis]
MDQLYSECKTKYHSMIENWKKAELDKSERYRVSSRNDRSSALPSGHLDDSIEVIDILSSPERDVRSSSEDCNNALKKAYSPKRQPQANAKTHRPERRAFDWEKDTNLVKL